MLHVKKIALLLGLVLLAGSLASCSSQSSEDKAMSVLSVRDKVTGDIVSIGDTRKEVEKITGSDERDPADFTDGVIRTGYWDNDGIYVDYLEDTVVALRLKYDSNWEIISGAQYGMSKEQVDDLYKDSEWKGSGLQGGLLLAFDKDLNPVTFNPEAPYIITISYDSDDVVDLIKIQDNLSVPDL